MGYPYEDLDDSQFERLVVECMRELFGDGVQSFTPGPDGGRDARFHGTAARFPSTAEPWTQITIGQAKHTNATNAHFSDSDFSSTAESSVLSEEIPRIRKLVADDEVHNYILFSNRRLGGVTAPAIIKRLAEETGLDKYRIHLAGIEFIDATIQRYPDILRRARIDPLDGPLLVSSYDLAEVILAISKGLEAPLPPDDAPVVDRVGYEEKNRINGMTPEFAKVLKDRYLHETHRIKRFLADPSNADILRHYEGAVDEFQLKIIAKRKSYQSFDALFNYLVDLLFNRDAVLSRNRRLTRAMVFYMYWHCDIGETPDAAAQ
ncbi:ABC-three component system protein [Micromonospora sp. NPDC023814]|uniref:ABC-three component system protein n=1 Tax=Micromonospora sp. NPDC023814 TaxID=3154596 RepID=UPI0033CD9DE2